jgi:predicted RNA polymerase sigma factor
MTLAPIHSCHAEASSWTATDWRQIVLLYDLLRISPSPVVQLNRAVALRQVEGPEVALSEVLALTRNLEHYHLFHAIRGELPLELSEREQARASALCALDLTQNRAEQSLLARRLLEW